MLEPGIYVRKMQVVDEYVQDWNSFPMTVPVVKELPKLDLQQQVTILAGENGTGKSTILEGLAELAGISAVGGSKNMQKGDFEPDSLARCCRLQRASLREHDGFFLRAEGYMKVADLVNELDVVAHYGGNPHERSHGEAFLALVYNRFRKQGLYILDEPESALSPTRQLSLMIEMQRLVNLECQFIMATHSPILMAYPGAKLYWLSEDGIEEKEWRKTEHYAVMRRMLEDPDGYLASLGLGGEQRRFKFE